MMLENVSSDVVFSKLWNIDWFPDSIYDSENISNIPFPHEIWHRKPMQEIAVKTTVMAIVGVIGLFLNFVILFILAKNKWLWSPSNLLITNLALSDAMTLFFCPWFSLVRDFFQNDLLKVFGCTVQGFINAFCILGGVGAVILVSYDRLATAALTADARVTKEAAPKLMIISWTVACLLSLPWIAFKKYEERQWLDHLEKVCVVNIQILGVYWYFIIIVVVWIPLLLLIITYGSILWKLNRSTKYFVSRGCGTFVLRARARAVKITACVLLAAILCKIPYTVVMYWRGELHRQGDVNNGEYSKSFNTFWYTANFLLYLDCALNPLIYGFTNRRFLRAMDRTPGTACFRFGSWCCTRKTSGTGANMKVFVIADHSPKPKKKLKQTVQYVLHIKKDGFKLEQIDTDDVNNKTREIITKKFDNPVIKVTD